MMTADQIKRYSPEALQLAGKLSTTNFSTQHPSVALEWLVENGLVPARPGPGALCTVIQSAGCGTEFIEVTEDNLLEGDLLKVEATGEVIRIRVVAAAGLYTIDRYVHGDRGVDTERGILRGDVLRLLGADVEMPEVKELP